MHGCKTLSAVPKSLPTRERGLKSLLVPVHSVWHMSLPTRERGLKSGFSVAPYRPSGSLPTRERGLKSGIMDLGEPEFDVAPYTGAWIEITLRWTS